VLDWGGTGRVLVLLAGLGNTAHVFDGFAPKLTAAYHVYGITRRGFGASSSPSSGYSADRLGDDILVVLDTLKIYRPVLVGHSIAGEELSSVGTRHPEKVAGLIYLEAGYAWAYYDPAVGDFDLDSLDLKRKLELVKSSSAEVKQSVRELETRLAQLDESEKPQQTMQLITALLQTNIPHCEGSLRGVQNRMKQNDAVGPKQNGAKVIEEVLQTSFPTFERDLHSMQNYLRSAPLQPTVPDPTSADLASFTAFRSWLTRVEGVAMPEAELRQHYASKPNGGVGEERNTSKASDAIAAGQQKCTDSGVPVLAIYSLPQDKVNSAREEAQAKAFERGVPYARVVWVPHANHYVFLPNEADVLREMNAFLIALSKRGLFLSRFRSRPSTEKKAVLLHAALVRTGLSEPAKRYFSASQSQCTIRLQTRSAYLAGD